MRLVTSVLALSLSFASQGCKESKPKEQAPTSAEAKEKAAPPSEVEPLVAEESGKSGIRWVENDYQTALNTAKRASKPLVIDMWASWCHTCLSMKKSVLKDAGLAADAGDFVWLAVDTENPASAEAMAKFPPKVWPTFFVVSPVDESVQATQLGSCSVADFRNFLGRGQSGHLAQLEAGGQLPEGSALAHLRAGDQAWLSSDYQGAAKSYAAALEVGGEGWPHAGPTLKNQIAALAKNDDKSACATLGKERLADVAAYQSSASTDFSYYASTCADALGKKQGPEFQTQLLATLDSILANEDAALSYDDRSDALGISRAIAEALKDTERAQAYARSQQALLAKAVASSLSAIEEMTYVWHQVEVHAFLNEGEKVLPWIESLEKRLPREYDPPYRKAWLLAQMKRNAEAHIALKAALPLVEGARRGRLLSLGADLYKADKDLVNERATREAIVEHYESLPEGLRSQSKIDEAKKELAAMGES